MKLLRPFTGTGAIFWPIGLPPQGTCEFATKLCQEHCYAKTPDWPDFDEELRVPEKEKHEIRQAMLTMPIRLIKEAFLSDLDGLQTDILHWFGSGDCPTTDTKRVLDIIDELDEHCTQMGFTRNITLWEAHKDIFALTVESVSEIKGREGLFAVTDYVNGTSHMYKNASPTRGGHCGPELCMDRLETQLTHFINCKICRRLKTGCFNK